MKKIVLIVLVCLFAASPLLADPPTVVTYHNKDGSRTNVTHWGNRNVTVERIPSFRQRVGNVATATGKVYEATGQQPKSTEEALAMLFVTGLFVEPVTTLTITGCVIGGAILWEAGKEVIRACSEE